MGLWVLAGSWAARGLTDGHVPEYMLDELACDAEDAKWLVYAGLWFDDPAGNGWWFHQWNERQPTRDVVESRREVRAAAGRQGGLKSGQSRRATSEAKAKQVASTDEASASGVASTRTNPRPDPNQNQTLFPGDDDSEPAAEGKSSPPNGRRNLSSHFDEWYDHYPRKEGRAEARRAWDAARKRASIEVLLAGVIRYSTDPNLPDLTFIPYPAKWLKHDRWTDGPLPPREGSQRRAEPSPMKADGSVDADAVLGRDLWQPPAPPPEIQGGTREYVAYIKQAWADHHAERQQEARERLAARSAQ